MIIFALNRLQYQVENGKDTYAGKQTLIMQHWNIAYFAVILQQILANYPRLCLLDFRRVVALAVHDRLERVLCRLHLICLVSHICH